MRIVMILAAIVLAACAPAEKEVLTMSVDVDESGIAALLEDIDAVTDNALPVDELHEFAISTPMDSELEQRLPFVFEGNEEEVQIHVWREQVDWVHLYFSTTSEDLLAALKTATADHARN